MHKGNMVIGQSGGPTAVINASLIGAVTGALEQEAIGEIYGMRWGIEGFMQEQLVDLGRESRSALEAVSRAPSSGLGSCRHKVQDADLPRILEVLQKHEIRFFCMIGGDDTQDTTHRVTEYWREEG